MQDLDKLQSEALAAVAAATTLDQLEAARVAALGKKGTITGLMKSLGGMGPDERKAAGAALNAARGEVEGALAAAKATLEAKAWTSVWPVNASTSPCRRGPNPWGVFTPFPRSWTR
ncbi:hypothetical protein amb4382 [Paramagnetospirillum magneticum AMB-1]|uniref:Phenylalanine-tRNA ligase class II N-terminal domain-containing protein n=1 Tax=Paramagnetospirillum magneticum (strain ATCC 700264 / AMB-1) TaxID=342108 RepID=Q2VYY9_PARM1|nr:hypothetical protein amb4382 [Paramagnetospirillum magneticum AMB-1]